MGWGAGLLMHANHVRRRWSNGSNPSDPQTLANLRLRWFWEHFGAWAVMSVVFLAVDLWTSGKLTWAFYPILGWGLGVYFHRRNLLHSSL